MNQAQSNSPKNEDNIKTDAERISLISTSILEEFQKLFEQYNQFSLECEYKKS